LLAKEGAVVPRDPFEGLPEDLPVDILPASNNEFYPRGPNAQEIRIMRLADEKTEEVRRRTGMSRRDFVRTGLAMAIGFWAVDAVAGGKYGRYALGGPLGKDPTAPDLCSMKYPNVQLANLPGEFIFDVQSHHVESDGIWRAALPVHWAVIAILFGQLSNKGGELDPTTNVSRPHYIKELFLDSSTTMTVLSPVPAAPDITNPLPFKEALHTAEIVYELSGTERTVVHSYVMPNRGSTKSGGSPSKPLFLQEELDVMMERGLNHSHFLRGYKVYSPYSDVPYGPGFQHHDDVGLALADQVQKISQLTGGRVPPCLASHKGPQLPGFDALSNSCVDVGPAARQFPGVNFIIYHSGAGSGTSAPYPGDAAADATAVSVDSLIKSLRVNSWDAESHIPAGMEHGNSPNVFAEIGSTWRGVMGNPNSASHFLGKLVKHVGAQRVIWGTDDLWYGSPQPEIVALRSLQMTDAAKELYNLPYGLDGDRFDPRRNALDAASYMVPNTDVSGWPLDATAHPERTIRNGIFGRNAAVPYRVDPDEKKAKIDCSAVNEMRNEYFVNQFTDLEERPGASNYMHAPRTRREVDALRTQGGWAP
jgi:hypothetical protein